MSGTGRKITKRACDGCKIRKIKCSGLSPCDGCIAVRISCTYLKHPSTRGPRKLRTRTLQEIAQTQQQQQQQQQDAERSPPIPVSVESLRSPPVPVHVTVAKNVPNSRIPVASLVLHLCVYRLRMFPVWPIVRVEEIIARLQRNQEDIENYALATAVAAATVSQLKLTPASLGGDAVTAEMLEAECQRTRSIIDKARAHSLTTLRIAFFLHVYYENQEAGGVKSLLYLREAITLGQMMGLHKESSYMTLSSWEQQMRRRVLWLLFVTERGVAMLHKLPVVLKVNVAFPSVDRNDETFVLPAFQKLVNLFWIFDQSGAFDILQDSDAGIFGLEDTESPNRTCLDLLQRQLGEIPVESESINDIQTADICVTLQWMRAVLWKFSVNHGLLSSASADQVASLYYPLQIAREFLSMISHIPNSAIEAHGQGIELKIYEIASSVTDAIAKIALAGSNPWNSLSSADRPGDILNQLHRILSSCRGGNKTLVSMLCNKIAEVQNGQMLLIQSSNRIIEEEDSPEQWPTRTSDTLNSQMNFNMGMNLGSMDRQTGFSEQSIYQEESVVQDFGEDPERDDLSLEPSISSNSNIPLGISQTSPSSQQRQQSFLPYNLWNIQNATNIIPNSIIGSDRTREGAALHAQLQQDFNEAFSINNLENLNGIDQFTERNGDMWSNSEMGLSIDGLQSAPEAIEQWN